MMGLSEETFLQNNTLTPSQSCLAPESGPKNPPGDAVEVMMPKLLFVPVLHNWPLPDGPGVVASAGHVAPGLLKCGVFVRPNASARTRKLTDSQTLKSRTMLRFALK